MKKESSTLNPSDKAPDVPYLVHQTAMARNERSIKRMLIALIISVIINFATVCAFLYVWQLYDYESEQSYVDINAEDGNANYVGRDGSIVNGEDNR